MDKDQKGRLLKSKRDHSPCDRMKRTSTWHAKCSSDARGIPLVPPRAGEAADSSRRGN
jgi:hypothetical protein